MGNVFSYAGVTRLVAYVASHIGPINEVYTVALPHTLTILEKVLILTSVIPPFLIVQHFANFIIVQTSVLVGTEQTVLNAVVTIFPVSPLEFLLELELTFPDITPILTLSVFVDIKVRFALKTTL